MFDDIHSIDGEDITNVKKCKEMVSSNLDNPRS